MSGHFVCLPSQHENLPVVPDNAVIPKGVTEDDPVAPVFLPSQNENLCIVPEKIVNRKGDKEDDLDAEINLLQEGKSEEKVGKNWRIDRLDVTEDCEEFQYVPLFEEKGHTKLSAHVPGLNLDEKEQDLFYAAKLVSLHNATVIGDSDAYDERAAVNDLVETSVKAVNPSSLTSQTPNSNKDEADDSELPCEDWWKTGVACICAQAKETDAFWSIFVAAAVVGLLVLGQRWQQESLQIFYQRSQLSIADEKSGRILSGLKDAIVVGSHHGSYINVASAEL